MKTKMNNKMFQVILLVAIFATIQVPTLYAQESSASTPEVSFVYSSGAQMEIGDSVMINKDSLRYLTGERMSTWVYGVPHQIRQLGTKTKPTGVLLRGIYSWIAQGSLIPLNVKKTQEYIDEQKAAEEAIAEAARLAEAAAAEEAARAKMLEEFIEEEDTVVEKDTVVPDLPFQINRFSVGVHGGLASLMPQATPSLGATWGYDVALDLQYAHYWTKGREKVRLGLLTGLSVGYMQNQKTMKNPDHELYDYSTAAGVETKYNISMDEVKVSNSQIQLEVPLMFSMVTAKGFFLNVGPKFILPVYTPYAQTVKGTTITATDVLTGNVMVDNPVMGRLDKEFAQEGMNSHLYDLTIAVGGELGYEHQLQSGHSISVGLYANYGVFSTYKNETDGHIISIKHPLETGTIGEVTVNSMNDAYANKLGYLDLGLKVAFHLNWKK